MTKIETGGVLHEQNQLLTVYPFQCRLSLSLNNRFVGHALVTPKNGRRLWLRARYPSLTVYFLLGFRLAAFAGAQTVLLTVYPATLWPFFTFSFDFDQFTPPLLPL